MQVNEVTERKITDKRQAFFLFVICWMAYFTCYIGRLNYSSAMAAMIEEAVLTKTQAGTISMVYFFVYGSGQLLNGFLGDRLPPGRMIFGGLFLSMICNLLMGVSGSFGIMAVVLGVGDSFHLVPRAVALCTTGLENFTAALGVGKFITSITMTVFYILLYYVWRVLYHIDG